MAEAAIPAAIRLANRTGTVVLNPEIMLAKAKIKRQTSFMDFTEYLFTKGA